MSSVSKFDASIATSAMNEPNTPARSPVDQRMVEDAVRVLIAWAGDDPDREELIATPARVAEAFKEYFRGYREDALAWLQDADVDMARGYDDMVMLRDVRLQSFCEHHLTPFEGKAHIAYIPGHKVVGLSRLVRVVDTLARRLQTQEALTHQIAEAIETGLKPRGVAVLIEAEHQCMSLRGVRQSGVAALTHRFAGDFEADDGLKERFMRLAGH